MYRMRPFAACCALAAVALFAAPDLRAQTCQAPLNIVWPSAENPVWQMDAFPPSQSTGADGSGLEIRSVRYNGRLVMGRGHVPILNVKYDTDQCGCYRDWSWQEVEFEADGEQSTCLAESTAGTVRTICDVGGQGGDIGSFTGVAVERTGDRLILTTQMQAGWYRYDMTWVFHADGRINPMFGFAGLPSPCTENPRRHHAYWRLDFDIEGNDSDYVVEMSDDMAGITFEEEALRTWRDPEDEVTWSVLDAETGRGYRVVPGASDYLTPANPGTGNPDIDNFAPHDAVIARYAPAEVDDGSPGCEAEFTGGDPDIVNGDNVLNTDVVFWYRSGVTKPDAAVESCYMAGPTLEPIGDWSAPDVAGEEAPVAAGFELDAFPSPFERNATIRFSVERPQAVTVVVYDALGRAVRTVFDGEATAGSVREVTFDASNLPNGAYTVRLIGETVSGTTRIVLLR